jgi:hypothetical protein
MCVFEGESLARSVCVMPSTYVCVYVTDLCCVCLCQALVANAIHFVVDVGVLLTIWANTMEVINSLTSWSSRCTPWSGKLSPEDREGCERFAHLIEAFFIVHFVFAFTLS